MNMRSYFLLTLLALAISLAVACGGPEDPAPRANANANTNAANQNGAAPVGNSVLEPVRRPPDATSNEAPTLAPVIHAYYDGLKKKDAAAVRSVMARDFLQKVDADMKDENKTDLVAFLTEFDKLPEPKMEVRNELITGNKATAEVKGGVYGTWTKVTFYNEGGTWKLSNEVPKSN